MKVKEIIAQLEQMPQDAEAYIEMIDGCAAVNTIEHYQVGEREDAPQAVVFHTPHFYRFCKATGWCE